MSIFGNIMSGILGHGSAKVQPTSTGSVAPSPTSASSSTAAATSAAVPASQVDVEAVLSKLASQNKEKLDWRKSIVDQTAALACITAGALKDPVSVLTLFSDKIISRMVAIRQPTTEFIGSAIV
jgi:Domain of unknown function (DUF3597)